MIIDEVLIKVSGGKGGDGIVAFSKDKMKKGPTGGDGGKGGDVYLIGTNKLSALNKFRFTKEFSAENGQRGGNKNKTGADGKDLFLNVPVGTVIHKNDEIEEIVEIGEKKLIARGGVGGRGNFFFRSSQNTTPQEFELGKDGESASIHLELKLIAHIGLVGKPNVGKSTLLNLITHAKAKIGNYEFTTLGPNLGVYENVIIADIPGLIEGASKGKGLGIKFLKHIERTKVIFHLISSDSKNLIKDYKIIRKELGDYKKSLIEKPEYVFLTKSDFLSQKEIEEKINILKKEGIKAIPISMFFPESLESVIETINSLGYK